MATEKDVPLRQDVKMLGELLGEVLREQGDDALFAQVEKARRLARTRRQAMPLGAQPGDAPARLAAESALDAMLQNLPPQQALNLVRAFSAYFTLVNLAERMHRIRRRRDALEPGAAPQVGSLQDVLQRLADAGVTWDAVQAHLETLLIQPVFTAHPTEATRREMLQKEQRMARALAHRLSARLLPIEDASILNQIRSEIAIAWQTDELAHQPTVADEVEHIIFYVTEVIYRIVPVFYEGIQAAARKVYHPELAWRPNQPLVRFGTWVGGDMDGNPNVGAQSIRNTLARQRHVILQRYSQELKTLSEYLTQGTPRVAVDPLILQRVGSIEQSLGADSDAAHKTTMPYRALLALMAEKVQATDQDKIHGYQSAEHLIEDLRLILKSLNAHKAAHAGAPKIQRLLYRVETFGFHLATLDIRQDALIHRRAVGYLLGQKDFLTQTSAEKTAHMHAFLKQPPRPVPADLAPEESDKDSDPAQLKRCLDVMHTIVAMRKRYGQRALGPYIISMAEGVDDVLAVMALAHQADVVDAHQKIDLDIAPLFETVPDLKNAGTIFEQMLADPLYRAHLKARGDAQLIMLGYSDSNKESGLVASRWALQTAQRTLVDIAFRHQIRLTFFHGRGGSSSRGGSKPREAILAEPENAVCGRLRLTEQGEIIHAKYGLRDIALRTMELMGGAVLEVSASPKHNAVPEKFMQLMQSCAQLSRDCYRRLVYDDPNFFAYFTQATPIDVISRLRIGSRPGARRAQKGIQDLRAIPWVFSWTQNRQMLPAWYGLGTALQNMEQQASAATLRQMYANWPFFKNLIDDTETALAKADMLIGARYAALAGAQGEPIWQAIQIEFEKTQQILQEIQSQADHGFLHRSIRLRNPYVDPMSLIQVDLLPRWRATDRQDAELERVLLSSVKGIARGLQNTG